MLITTPSFSQQAIAYAGTVDGVVLVDGRKLADLMIEHEVDVTSRPARVPKIDSDYPTRNVGRAKLTFRQITLTDRDIRKCLDRGLVEREQRTSRTHRQFNEERVTPIGDTNQR